MQKRLLIDLSHVLKSHLHVAKMQDSATTVEFEGKEVSIPDKHEAYEIFLTSFQKTLRTLNMTPRQCVIVKDGVKCKAIRRQWLPGYCKRPPQAPEFMQVFLECQDMVEETLLKYGAISMSKVGIEADDIIAALADKMPCITWSGDKDLLAAAGDLFFDGELNPDKFFGIAKKHIVVYKSLVGDTSDKIPGSVGFGEKAFLDMITKYGDEALDELLEMLENETLDQLEQLAEEFKPFKKILADLPTVYASYKCAKFHHPGWYNFDWRAAYPEGNGTFREWEPSIELITSDNFTPEFLKKLQQEMQEAPYNSFDIEGYTTAEGKAWAERNKNKQGKKPLDVRGQVMTGFSINTGVNCKKTYYFSMEHADTNNLSHEQVEQVLNSFPDDIPLLVHKATFELPVVRCHFDLRYDRGWLPPLLYDTKILSGYVNEYEQSGLKHQSKLRLNYDQQTYEDVTTIGGVQYDMNQLSGKHVLKYGADDSIVTGSLFNLFEVITHFEDTWNAYEEVDVVAPFVYSERFVNGQPFDLEELQRQKEASDKEFAEHYAKIQDFLKDLSWEEKIELPKKRYTIEDIKAGKVSGAGPELQIVQHRWPGSEFVPATELSPREIKRLYKEYTGETLTTRFKLLEKIAESIPEEEFADLVRTKDLKGLNKLCEDNFQPDPQIGLQSPKDMCTLLYDALGLPVRIRGKISDIMRSKGIKQGNPSANESAIQHAIVYDLQEDPKTTEFLKTVLLAKSRLTEDGFYLRPYANLPHWKTGLVHPEFAVAAQKSGRGTASHPNDSQVARESGIRKVYVPYKSDDPNDPYVWCSCDYSSQELVHTAEHCKDENMMNCFRGERRDIHSITGAAIYNLEHPDAPVTYEEFFANKHSNPEFKAIRKEPAKRTNFLKNYGGLAQTLAIKLLISEEKAQAMIDAQSAEFPGVDAWIGRMAKINAERGYAVCPIGRRRHLGYVLDGSWKDAHEIRAAGNHQIQAGSAAQVKLTLKRMWQQRLFERYDAFFAGTIHDQWDAIVRMSHVVEFLREAHAITVMPFADFELQFQSSIEIGWNFGDLTEIGVEFDEEKIKAHLEKMMLERDALPN